MTVQITKIEIHNFRSARNLVISPQRLAVLVGRNDSGKSNVLRALNLFFNNQTGSGDNLRFDVDHNIFNQPNRRAKEISVKLDIELPPTYHATNGDFVVWEKRWRASGPVGPVQGEYRGQRRVKSARGKSLIEEVEIPKKSNVHTLLRNIHFIYVPAIKDPEYFSKLRASIYDVIAEVADQTFRESSRDFEQSISDQLYDLTTEITTSLGLQSRLALPRDMSHIFESLDFLSEGQNISLDVRGDGIKARHIPLILKFMADKRRSLQGKGAPPHLFIWGYEEPENNLELASCMELADQFWDFVNDGISQVFLTTHSPVFYNLRDKEEKTTDSISCHHIFRDTEEEGTKKTRKPSDLDERMGTMTMFAPMVKELTDRIRQEEAYRAKAEELARANRRKLFVEGPSDRAIIKKALRVFAPDRADKIDVETREHGAGYNFVIDMLGAWTAIAKHTPSTPRAAGLVDRDPAAKKAADEWNKESKNIQHAKCFKLKTPCHIIPVLEHRFGIPVVLETIYDHAAWKWAETNGYLIKRNNLWSILPCNLRENILENNTTLEEHLEPDWEIYVRREFSQRGKSLMAQCFAQKTDEDFRKRLPCLKQDVDDIVAYLFPEPEVGPANEEAKEQVGPHE